MDEDKSKSVGMVNERTRKFWQFSSNEFWKNIGCLVSAHTFVTGGSRMWDKEEAQKISIKKRKIRSIGLKIDFYEVFLSYIIYCRPYYIMTIITPFCFRKICGISHTMGNEFRNYWPQGFKLEENND